MTDLHSLLISAPDLDAALSKVTDRDALRAVLGEGPSDEIARAVEARLQQLTDRVPAAIPSRKEVPVKKPTVREDVPVTLSTLAGGDLEIRFQEALAEIGDAYEHPDVLESSSATITVKVKITKMVGISALMAVADNVTITPPKRRSKARPIRRVAGVYVADPEEQHDDAPTRFLPFPANESQE